MSFTTYAVSFLSACLVYGLTKHPDMELWNQTAGALAGTGVIGMLFAIAHPSLNKDNQN